MLSTKRVLSKSMAKKKTTAKKVPKTDPQQQRFLKTRFKANKPIKKQSSVPPSQRIWRRTAVQTKPKLTKRIPKLFRMDRHTGLPVDYERTVQRVMHYVNPHLANRPRTEQVLEELLAKLLAEVVRQGGHHQNTQLRSLLKDHCNCRRKDMVRSKSEQRRREANESLDQFHSACKRGPFRLASPKLGPTCISKFNFNQLRIKST
ncbi:uncharacterized protein LOC108029039 [Drosophila biarmipes]|uniref:uncharacterized protein LOC108029039 n=1 Tax=Drosophila biarmipes TaxID=125945 RepID=UPI0007E6A3C5|nr:uncharacterized protein LOC108029039 [Drosophila biarmipes]